METLKTKILIIDDDPLYVRIIADAFLDNGFDVVTAEDGIKGIRTYLDEMPDVVIVDLVMPRLGGVSTCLEINRLGGDSPPIVVLLTSMFKGAPHEHADPEMGSRIHIPKSTKPLDIVIIVEQFLSRGNYSRLNR